MIKRYSVLLLLILFLLTTSGCQRQVITFVDYDGSILQEIKGTGNAIIPEEPTREGYTFIGWDQDLQNITSSTTVTARYQANEYHIQFLDLEDEITVLYNDVVETLPAIVQEYHKFLGWTYQGELITLPFTYNYAQDLVLEPSFRVGPTCKVRFYDANDEVIQTTIVEAGNGVVAPSIPLKTGYEFLGWDNAFDVVNNDLHVKPLYRPLEFNVYFDEIPDANSIVVKYDEIISLPNVTRNGYIFEGWRCFDSLFFDQLTFNYLEDIHITPQFRVDDYAEMMKLQSNVSIWSNVAESYQISQTIKIKEYECDTNYLISLSEITAIFPGYDYIESMTIVDRTLESYIAISKESSSYYLYNIAIRPGQTNIYTKQKWEEPVEIVDYDALTVSLFKQMTCEKVDYNTFVLTSTFGDYDFFKELVALDSQFNQYKDEQIRMTYYFDEVNNGVHISIKATVGLILEFDVVIDHYNQIEKIDFQSDAYELKGTADNPEIISDINETIIKTQVLKNGATYSHYYQVELEEGYYLFDLEKNASEFGEPKYDISFSQVNNQNFDQPFFRPTKYIPVNQKKIFYVEGGTYRMNLTGNHQYGYSFRFQKLNYVSDDDFTNPLPLTNTISGVIEGFYDLNVYKVGVLGSSKSLCISNLETPITIVCIHNGSYEVREWFEGINSFSFILYQGEYTIVITGTEATSFNLNITIED